MILHDIAKDIRRCIDDADLLLENPATGPDACPLRVRVASMRKSLTEAYGLCYMAIIADEDKTYQPSTCKSSVDKSL